MIQYRQMVETDIPAALALWQGMPGIGLRDADNPVAIAKYLNRNPGCSFVATTPEGKLVGVGLAGHDGRRGYLHHVAVAPDLQRHGIGRTLVERCCEALTTEGIEKVNLWVKADNAEGMKFWQRLGGQHRADLAIVSLILGDNPNA